MQITWKKWNKEHQTLSFHFFTNRFNILMFFVLFFHLVCKISNFYMWTEKHMAQASCTELTLSCVVTSSSFVPNEKKNDDGIFFCPVQNYLEHTKLFWSCSKYILSLLKDVWLKVLLLCHMKKRWWYNFGTKHRVYWLLLWTSRRWDSSTQNLVLCPPKWRNKWPKEEWSHC